MDTLEKTDGLKPPTGFEGLDSVTLTRFVLHGQRQHPEAQGDLTILLAAVQLACKVTETCVRRAGIAKLYGLAGSGNVQGEDQKKLDIIANDTFKANIDSCGKVCCMVSEEEPLAIVCGGQENNITIGQNEHIDYGHSYYSGEHGAKYAVAFDPLDGSSNIDANVSIGSIFAIYKIEKPELVKTPKDAAHHILKKGIDMVAAGYAMYGSATNLVISVGMGQGVHGFTLDPSLGEFVLTHPDIRVPKRGKIYSVNEGNAKHWDRATKEYINNLKFPKPGSGRQSYSLRYIGSMVADVHRTLFYGGIFCYPTDSNNPTGKLRLLYEAAPTAFLMVNAGGKATTGKQDILDIMPEEIHQRVPVFMGSTEDVEELEKSYEEYS